MMHGSISIRCTNVSLELLEILWEKTYVSTREGIFPKIVAIWVRALQIFSNIVVCRKNLSKIGSKACQIINQSCFEAVL